MTVLMSKTPYVYRNNAFFTQGFTGELKNKHIPSLTGLFSYMEAMPFPTECCFENSNRYRFFHIPKDGGKVTATTRRIAHFVGIK
jgi:hypothetical protein